MSDLVAWGIFLLVVLAYVRIVERYARSDWSEELLLGGGIIMLVALSFVAGLGFG